MTGKSEGGDSTRTILVAVAANLAIAVAKTVAALLSGSTSMWAEAAHSFADSGNEVLLWVGLRRSDRGPDGRHPFGYGQERFFWAFLAALGIFLIGGALSIGEGIRGLLLPQPLESVWIGVAVLGLAFVFEGYSWLTARRQLRSESRQRRRSMTSHLRLASDPSAPTVFLEDSAALIGVGLALVALVLHAATGWAAWDAAGSIGIGLLLIVVAFLLARRTKGLLLEEAAPEDVVAPIRAEVGRAGWVDQIHDLHAVYVGPSSLLVNMWVSPVPDYLGRPSSELLCRVDELRSTLLAQSGVSQVTITLEREPRGPAMHGRGGSG